jgi:hypothetical protein
MPNWKKVIVSGSDASLNSLNISNGITLTGSLGISGSTGTLLSANVDTIIFTGSAAISGTLNITDGITGSLFGTASYAISASYAATASSADTFVVRTALTASGLNYPTADGLEGQVLQTNGTGTLSFGDVETIFEEIYTGEAITKSDPLYISGSQGAKPIVYKADAADPNKMPVTFIASETIGAGNDSRGIVLGRIDGLDLTGYTAGTEVYVAAGGGWTDTRPTGSAIVQVLGIVTKGGIGGQGLVLNPGPVELPNLQAGYAWVGDTTGVPQAVPTSSLLVTSASFATTASFALNALSSANPFPYTHPKTITGSISIPDEHNGLLMSPVLISGSITIGSGSSLLTIGPITGSSSVSASFASTSSYSTNILGTTNYIAKFTGDNTLSSSIMFENNGKIGVNDTSPTHRFQVSGDVFAYNSSNTLNITKYSLIGALNSTVTGSETNQYANTGIYGSLGHSATTGTFTPQDDSFVSAFFGQFSKSGGGNISGKVSSFAAGINLSGAGNVTTIAGFRAYAPLQSFALPSFSGTLTNYIGLLIDDITGTTDVGSQITNKYGIYQVGASDKNYIAGSTTINNVLQLGQQHPLPAGADGQLAVSASNLYFFSGSAWNKISFA